MLTLIAHQPIMRTFYFIHVAFYTIHVKQSKIDPFVQTKFVISTVLIVLFIISSDGFECNAHLRERPFLSLHHDCMIKGQRAHLFSVAGLVEVAISDVSWNWKESTQILNFICVVEHCVQQCPEISSTLTMCGLNTLHQEHIFETEMLLFSQKA